jgi:SAM-dependent methyltransferase
MIDLGCGTGHASLRFARKFQSVVAVDHSHAMLQMAAQNLRSAGIGHVEIVQQDVLDFLRGRPAASADAVFCVGFLHHLTEDGIAQASPRPRESWRPAETCWSANRAGSIPAEYRGRLQTGTPPQSPPGSLTRGTLTLRMKNPLMNRACWPYFERRKSLSTVFSIIGRSIRKPYPCPSGRKGKSLRCTAATVLWMETASPSLPMRQPRPDSPCPLLSWYLTHALCFHSRSH